MKTSRPRTTPTVRALTTYSIGRLSTCMKNDFNRISCRGEGYFSTGRLSCHFGMRRPPSQSSRDPARFGVHLQDLFNRFRMSVRSFNKSLLDGARDIVEGDRSLEERGDSHLIGSI